MSTKSPKFVADWAGMTAYKEDYNMDSYPCGDYCSCAFGAICHSKSKCDVRGSLHNVTYEWQYAEGRDGGYHWHLCPKHYKMLDSKKKSPVEETKSPDWTVIKTKYHRNGISGVGFVAATVKNPWGAEDSPGVYLITSEKDEDDRDFDRTRTRVISLTDSYDLEDVPMVESGWLGDKISDDILTEMWNEKRLWPHLNT